MPAVTTIVAIAAVAASVGGAVQARSQARKQAKNEKKRAKEAREAALAKKPSETTEAVVKLKEGDKSRKRGKGSLAQRTQAAALAGPSAASVGGL